MNILNDEGLEFIYYYRGLDEEDKKFMLWAIIHREEYKTLSLKEMYDIRITDK
ncbi:hypothetical protein [Butyrivibrio sp. XPD2002]|uniref:hypothetical protein n=1 Tax=Butyrivibrio sp. XPD2002 TaxID=1280665 RepID=UPI0012DE95D0|nr:hypothetical protein [Butyrivibrio sp. XPD2002]